MKFIHFALLLGISASTAVAQPPGPPPGGGGDKWDIKKLDASKLPAPSTKTGLTFDADIKPIFQESCFGCHGEKRQRGKLRLDSLDATLKGGQDGKIVVPGDSAKSLLVMAVSQLDRGTAMPPKPRGRPPGGPGGPGGNPPGAATPTATDAPTAPPPGGQAPGGPGGGPGGPGGGMRAGPPTKPLTSDQVALVRAWIDQGAK